MTTTHWLELGILLLAVGLFLCGIVLGNFLKRIERLEQPYFTTREQDRG